jgi:hypothetical protein
VEELVGQLGSSNSDVRKEAIDKLVSIGEPALPVLTKILSSSISDELRTAILDVTIRIREKMKSDMATKAENERATAENSNARPREVQEEEWDSLIPRELPEKMRQSIIEKLSSNKEIILIDVINDIGNRAKENKDRDMVPVIRKLLKHNEPQVRKRAIFWLGHLKDYESLEDALHMLEDPDADVRAEAIKSITQIGNRNAIPRLSRLLKDKDDWVRYNAVEAISTLGDSDIIPIIKPCLTDPADGVRRRAIFALARFRVREVLPEILKTITECKDEYWIATAYDILNNYTYPQTYEKLLNTNIGKEFEGDGWIECYKGFLSQSHSGVSIRLDDGVESKNWGSIKPGSVTTQFKLPAEMSLQEALWEITFDVRDKTTGEGIAYLIEGVSSVLIVSRGTALEHWNNWCAGQQK